MLVALIISCLQRSGKHGDGSTRGRGSNGAGNDEDGGREDQKCNKKTNGYDVVPVGKAESDLRQNHLTTESLCHCE